MNNRSICNSLTLSILFFLMILASGNSVLSWIEGGQLAGRWLDQSLSKYSGWPGTSSRR